MTGCRVRMGPRPGATFVTANVGHAAAAGAAQDMGATVKTQVGIAAAVASAYPLAPKTGVAVGRATAVGDARNVGTSQPFSNVQVTGITSSGFTVSWNVAPAASGELYTGLTSPPATLRVPSEPSALSFHSQVVTGLTADSDYYVQIKAPSLGGAAVSSIFVVHTLASAPSALPPVIAINTLWTPPASSVPTLGVLTADATTPGGTTHKRRINSGGGPYYATHPAFSPDGSLYFDHYSSTLYRTSDWTALRTIGAREPMFAKTTNARIYDMPSTPGNQFGYWPTAGGAFVPLFPLPGGYTTPSGTTSYLKADSGMSWDDRYVVAHATVAGKQRTFVIDRITSGTPDSCSIVGFRDWASAGPNYAKMSASGAYLLVDWEAAPAGSGNEAGHNIYNNDATLTHRRHTSNNGGHSDCGRDAAGNDVVVLTNPIASGGGNLALYRMDQVTSALDVPLLLPSGHGLQLQQGHVCTQGPDGWVLCSSSSAAGWFSRDYGWGLLVAMKMDGSGLGMVFGWHNSTYSNPDANYDKSPFATWSRDGAMVASHAWGESGGPSSGYTGIFTV